ncbi:DUF454 family protein [Secundilactobacillus similis]|nr:DUF454 family protein [Secundilactobacillus similis]
MQTLFMKIIWSFLTVAGFVGAIIGALLPVIPGIPFLILAIYSLKKLSPSFHRWLSNTRLAKWLQERQPKLAKWLVG